MMFGVHLPERALGGRRARVALLALLIVCIVVITLFAAPIVAPFTVESVSFTRNAFEPLTANPGFELNDNTWLISSPGPGSASIISGTSFSGNRSLFIHDPFQSVRVVYNNNDTRLLSLSINSSTALSFDLLYEGPDNKSAGGSSVWVTLFVSWRLDMSKLVPLTIILGDYPAYSDGTFDNVTEAGGVIMLRGVRSMGSWSAYDLQLGTPRVKSLMASYMLSDFGVQISNDDPLYVVAMVLQADNADAYFDNVGLYNVVASTATATVGKSTLLPADLLGMSTSVNGYPVRATDSYGFTSDSISFVMDLPLAYNATYKIAIHTGWGSTSIFTTRLDQSVVPTWI